MHIEMCANRWGIVWRADSRVDGRRRHLICDPITGLPMLFRTRSEARAYTEKRFGYIRSRADLLREPHGLKMPKVVKVSILYKTEEAV